MSAEPEWLLEVADEAGQALFQLPGLSPKSFQRHVGAETYVGSTIARTGCLCSDIRKLRFISAQSPHAGKPFQISACVGDFPRSAANNHSAPAASNGCTASGSRPRSPHQCRLSANHGRQLRSARKCAKRLRVFPCLRCKLKSQQMPTAHAADPIPINRPSIVFAGFASTAREG